MFQEHTSPSTKVKQFMVVYECLMLEDGTSRISPKRRWPTVSVFRVTSQKTSGLNLAAFWKFPADEKEKVVVRQELELGQDLRLVTAVLSTARVSNARPTRLGYVARGHICKLCIYCKMYRVTLGK